MENAKLTVQNLNKSFKGIHALDDFTLDFFEGEVHALLGENGAGKSTLCKMLSGALVPDSGKIIIAGQEYSSLTPALSKKQGIGMIYQEFNLVPEMTVYENIFLGKEIRHGPNVDKRAMIQKTNQIFSQLDINIDPRKKIKDLSVAYCQLVEVAKAMLEDAKFLIMDEPTAPLTINEVGTLFRLIKELKAKNVTIIYISHRIEELLELSDRVTVLRDGKLIKTLKTSETSRPELIKLMVGREISGEFPPLADDGKQGELILKVENLCTDKLENVSFELYGGEILGLAGLVGAGRTEIVRALFGADNIKSGQIWVRGRRVAVSCPADAIAQGICMIPEDRKRQGAHLGLSIKSNLSMAVLEKISKFRTVSIKKEIQLANKYINMFSIKFRNLEDLLSSMSGGNQQKIVVSKWLASNADIMFFDEPTRGIDVGTKKEIYDLMGRLRSEGKAIVMISSEMLEVIGMCNRVIVLYEGVVKGELGSSQMTQEKILELASGGALNEVAV